MATTITPDGQTLYYETAGTGETVALVGDAGFGAWQWAWQFDRLAGPYKALVWDMRGTGRSDAPPGPYTVDTLADDLEAVLDAIEGRRIHLVGAGLGGMVALRYARRAGNVASLALFGTAPDGSRLDKSALRDLYAPTDDAQALRDSLTGAFSADFLADEERVSRICDWRAAEDAPPAAVDAQVAAMTGFEAGPLHELTVPALVCQGSADPVVPVAVGQGLASDLPRGTFEPVAGKRLCFIEHSRAVTDRLFTFLDDHADSW